MAPEVPVKCDHCKSEEIVHGLKLGKLNAILGNVGGPGQEPPTIGNQWAVYWCLQCDAVFPYKRHYAGQPQIQAQYEKVYRLCKDRMDRKRAAEEAQKNLESIRSSKQTLASLPTMMPGAPGSYEGVISAAIAPLLARLETAEAELKRRKGGRPRTREKVPV